MIICWKKRKRKKEKANTWVNQMPDRIDGLVVKIYKISKLIPAASREYSHAIDEQLFFLQYGAGGLKLSPTAAIE